MNIDEDFDYRASGITRTSFCNVYHEWITFCAQRRENAINADLASGKVSIDTSTIYNAKCEVQA